MIKTTFNPTLNRMPIKMPLNPATANQQLGEARLLGHQPLVYYNGLSILPEYIDSLEINCDGFLPKLTVVFRDRTQEMHRSLMALDNTLITVYLDSRTKDESFRAILRSVQIDFKITEYDYQKDTALFVVAGVMNVDGMLLAEIKAYRQKTSHEVMQEIAKTTGLGFSSNVTTTNDRMTWLNTDLKNYLFTQEVNNKAYKDERSFFAAFVDFHYNLNFINVETQLKDDITKQRGIMTATLSGGLGETTQKEMPLYLINRDAADTGLNNTYDNYELCNQSLRTSVKNGYRTELYYYDKTGNWQQYAGTFVRFILETLTDGQGIIMKSIPNDDKTNSFYSRNTRKVYDAPVDTDNMHQNYSFAPLLNESNLEELGKVSIKLYMSSPNFNLYKYQKIQVIFMDGKPREEDSANILNSRLTGGWLITGISFTFDQTTGLIQELTLVKRELTEKNINV